MLGSGKGSNFAAIARGHRRGSARRARRRGDLRRARRGHPASCRTKHGAPALHLPPGRFKTKLEPEREQELAQTLAIARGRNSSCSPGYMRLLKEPLVTAFPRRIINIHPSLLPKFPGLAAWRQALEAGERETGCTVHYVDLGMDTGPMIAQARVPILPDDTAETLHARIQQAEHALYPQVRFADLAGPDARRFSRELARAHPPGRRRPGRPTRRRARRPRADAAVAASLPAGRAARHRAAPRHRRFQRCPPGRLREQPADQQRRASACARRRGGRGGHALRSSARARLGAVTARRINLEASATDFYEAAVRAGHRSCRQKRALCPRT